MLCVCFCVCAGEKKARARERVLSPRRLFSRVTVRERSRKVSFTKKTLSLCLSVSLSLSPSAKRVRKEKKNTQRNWREEKKKSAGALLRWRKLRRKLRINSSHERTFSTPQNTREKRKKNEKKKKKKKQRVRNIFFLSNTSSSFWRPVRCIEKLRWCELL